MLDRIDKDIKILDKLTKKKQDIEQSYEEAKVFYNKLPECERQIIKERCRVAGIHAKNDDTIVGFVAIMMSLYTIIINIGVNYLCLMSKAVQIAKYQVILNIMTVVVIMIGVYFVGKIVCGISEKRFIKMIPIILAIDADGGNSKHKKNHGIYDYEKDLKKS